MFIKWRELQKPVENFQQGLQDTQTNLQWSRHYSNNCCLLFPMVQSSGAKYLAPVSASKKNPQVRLRATASTATHTSHQSCKLLFFSICKTLLRLRERETQRERCFPNCLIKVLLQIQHIETERLQFGRKHLDLFQSDHFQFCIHLSTVLEVVNSYWNLAENKTDITGSLSASADSHTRMILPNQKRSQTATVATNNRAPKSCVSLMAAGTMVKLWTVNRNRAGSRMICESMYLDSSLQSWAQYLSRG